jgi:RAB protein geranylgeranyltransferase component A
MTDEYRHHHYQQQLPYEQPVITVEESILSTNEMTSIEHDQKNADINDKEYDLEQQPPTDQEEQQETVCRDEEGLLVEYDVIVCGTGLVQSIVASALTRAGKTVLHCDGADYYGELDTVWTISAIDELWKDSQATDRNYSNSINRADHLPPTEKATSAIQDKGEGVTANTTTHHLPASSSSPTDDIPVTSSSRSTTSIPLSSEGGRTTFRWHSREIAGVHNHSGGGIHVGTHVQTPYGDGVVQSISTTVVEIVLSGWTLANNASPKIYVGIDYYPPPKSDGSSAASYPPSPTSLYDPIVVEDVLYQTKQIRTYRSVQMEHILQKEHRHFALDCTPTFVLASGRAVQGMLSSGVADYLEFKAMEGLYWLEQQPSNSKKKDGITTTTTTVLSRVPCSKNDVFGTKLLAPMEKRRLMKFIQLSMDYATKLMVTEEMEAAAATINNKSHQDGVFGGNKEGDAGNVSSSSSSMMESEVQTLNEWHLNQGRSLARPQNKAVASGELQQLEECMKDGTMDFDTFLAEKFNLSEKLRSIVRYALAWEIDSTSATIAQGMATLRKHLQALGKYGTTAFLVPMYGSGELSQAFCRSAAVFGATYLLRRAPLAIQLSDDDHNYDEGDGNNSNNNKNTSISQQRRRRVCGILLSGDPLSDSPQQPKEIKCSHIVAPTMAIPVNYRPTLQQSDKAKRTVKHIVLRRISILTGILIPLSENGEQRHVVFIPPNTIGNENVIHAILLDSSVSVAPKGCSVLHLTTTIASDDYDDNINNDIDMSVLERAQAALLQSDVATSTSSREGVHEIYHVSFSHKCPPPEQQHNAELSYHDDEGGPTTTTAQPLFPYGLSLCSHTGQGLTADVAFEQAHSIFTSICPGMEFLGLADVIDKEVRDRVEEKRYSDDDEKTMLDSALGMLDDDDIDHPRDHRQQQSTVSSSHETNPNNNNINDENNNSKD